MPCRIEGACTIDGQPARLWTCETPWDWAKLLVRLARDDERDLAVRMLAAAFVDVPRDEQPAAVQEWTQANVAYKNDSPPARLAAWLERFNAGAPGDPFELFTGPGRTIAAGSGDCDDSSRVVRGVLRALGHDARLVFLGTPGEPSHVTAAIRRNDGSWYWLDASLPAWPGEHPIRAKERTGWTAP